MRPPDQMVPPLKHKQGKAPPELKKYAKLSTHTQYKKGASDKTSRKNFRHGKQDWLSGHEETIVATLFSLITLRCRSNQPTSQAKF